MNKSNKARYISKTLTEIFPNPPIPLEHTSVYTLLIAVILSAQCTDKRVNKTTPLLFSKASDAFEMIKLGEEKIREIIKPCGLSPKKSRSIFETSLILAQKYAGKVPESFEELESLPGVGHKTASIVMSQGFNHDAFPVDTHVHRLAQRWGLTNGKNVKQTEKDLKKNFPKAEWNRLHIQFILYGREFCKARECHGISCRICKKCNPERTKPLKVNKA